MWFSALPSRSNGDEPAAAAAAAVPPHQRVMSPPVPGHEHHRDHLEMWYQNREENSIFNIGSSMEVTGRNGPTLRINMHCACAYKIYNCQILGGWPDWPVIEFCWDFTDPIAWEYKRMTPFFWKHLIRDETMFTFVGFTIMREDIGSEKNASNTVSYHVTCKPYQPSMFVFYYLTASGFKHQGDPTSSPASTLPASDSQLETELARTYGIVTPKDKIRRGFSEPVLSNSREKGSLPSKLKKGHGRKKGKVKSKAVKKGGTGGGQTQPTAPPQPDSAPLPLPNGPPDIPAQSGTEPSAPPPPEPPVPGAQTEQPAAAPPNEGHPSPTGAPPSEPAVVPKPTAAKSMPAPLQQHL